MNNKIMQKFIIASSSVPTLEQLTEKRKIITMQFNNPNLPADHQDIDDLPEE